MTDPATRRFENLFTTAAVALLLLTGIVSQTWVVGLAGGLLIIGFLVFPSTRRLGIFAAVCAIVASVVAVVLLALVR